MPAHRQVKVISRFGKLNRAHDDLWREQNAELFLEERLNKAVGFEGLEIFDILADANILDGNAEFFLDADDDAPLGGAVKFGEHDAGDIGGFLEDPGLL